MGTKNGRKGKSRPRSGHAKSRGRGAAAEDDGIGGAAATDEAGWDFYLKSVYVRFAGRATDVALPRCRLALRRAQEEH